MSSRISTIHWHKSDRKKKGTRLHKIKHAVQKSSPIGRTKIVTSYLRSNGSVTHNHTGTEYMQLQGSTAVMASDDAAANPLTIILVIMSIFLFMTLSVTAAVLVFCRKKNTVFVLQKCEQEDEISYELDDINNTDIEFADFEGELESMGRKARKSATCPNLADSLEQEDEQSMQRLLDATESETDDSGKERSPVDCRLKQRSKSFTFQGSGRHCYQQMIVTAVMELRSSDVFNERQEKQNCDKGGVFYGLPYFSEVNLATDSPKKCPKNFKLEHKSRSVETLESDVDGYPSHDLDERFYQPSPKLAEYAFNKAKLEFLDNESGDGPLACSSPSFQNGAKQTRNRVTTTNIINSSQLLVNSRHELVQSDPCLTPETADIIDVPHFTDQSHLLTQISDQSHLGYKIFISPNSGQSNERRDFVDQPNGLQTTVHPKFPRETPSSTGITAAKCTLSKQGKENSVGDDADEQSKCLSQTGLQSDDQELVTDTIGLLQ